MSKFISGNLSRYPKNGSLFSKMLENAIILVRVPQRNKNSRREYMYMYVYACMYIYIHTAYIYRLM